MDRQQPPPLPLYQLNSEDESHINLLSVFHYVLAGIYSLGIVFLILHFLTMSFFFKMAEEQQEAEIVKATAAQERLITENEVGTLAGSTTTTSIPAVTHTPAPLPTEIIWIFSIFSIFMGVIILAMATCNFLSAKWLKQRKNYTFSMVIAGLNCACIPLGTILGVFTLIVLSRNSVKRSYAAKFEA